MLALECDQLGNSQASLNGDEKEGAIAAPEPGDGAGRAEQGFDLLGVEKFDNSAFEAFARDGKHALAVERVCRFRESDIAEEGVKRSEARVATAGGIFAFALKVVEEVAEESSVEVGNGQSRRGASQASRGETQKQAKRVSVGDNGMWARLSLPLQAISEEGLQQRGELGGGHGAPLREPIARSVASWRSSGTASMYQYVSATWTCPR